MRIRCARLEWGARNDCGKVRIRAVGLHASPVDVALSSRLAAFALLRDAVVDLRRIT